MSPDRVAASIASGSSSNCSKPNLSDLVGDHGTHVVGMAAGLGGNQTSAGFAKGGNLVPIQVFACSASDQDFTVYSSDITRELKRVFDLKDAWVKTVTLNMIWAAVLTPIKAFVTTITGPTRPRSTP